ncbi:AAA ATPase, central region [Xenorhabdus cabanillasii JM26]|uniref:ATPase family protein associated with various cellular activities (AAA) n=3 Tax=Xenorhabdus cabanillasii TaxID=351673 RepID=A0A3D9UDE3_9GAMM|nr:putative vacuolar sorting ATPase [Xenorhabdus cabanillasii JM26]REF27296.1 ATPase family protein associated with various cellular activities (AAA) [Xenorhabdus cabanillasii]CDL86338.1 AAA ATPase, central region [Xenorhabdus cabanillasii JM26]
MIKYMNLIATICRFALKDNPSQEVIKAILKLRDSLQKDGLSVEARALGTLVDKAESQTNIALDNKKITWSKSFLSSKSELTISTPLPVDKENNMPLVEVIFPKEINTFQKYHFFDDNITNAIDGILSEWEYAERLRINGIQPSYSCLFFGEPGTGKTELAKYLATKLNLPLISARLDSLLSSYLGTSARNISNLFDFAERYNCVLLLDEFDAIAKYRDDSKEVGEIKRVVNTLLQCLDRRKENGIVIATTNHEGLLDPAVWRRFQNKIKVPKPIKAIREKIISAYLSPMTISKTELSFLNLVLDGFTPAEIKNCIEFIKRFTIINEYKSVDLYHAIKSYFVINANYNNEITKSILAGSDHELAKNLILKHDYSIQDVSILVGKHKSTVSRWVKDKNE